MVKGKRAKLIVYIAIGILLLAAVVLSININKTSELNKVCRTLRQYGYSFGHDDLYIAGNAANSTIEALWDKEEEPAEAVSASLQAGFPSRTDRAGDVVLLLATEDENDIVTIYVLDGEIELCFVQRLSDGKIMALERTQDE